jgi:hypothetical protein
LGAIGAGAFDLHRSLLTFGDEGWELVSIVPFSAGSKPTFKAIFKRPQFQAEASPEPKEYTMKLGALRRHLDGLSDDFDVIFGQGNLEFYRTKLRGEKLVQIEFSQMTDMVPDKP